MKDARALSVKLGGEMPSIPHMQGRVFHQGASTDGALVGFDDASGCLGAAAALLSDRRLLVSRVVERRYNGMDEASDRVRLEVVDPGARRREVLAEPACNPAVSSSGRIAYVAGDGVFKEHSSNYRGRIMVQKTARSRAVPWTEAASWCYPYWAGSRLLVKTCASEGYSGELFVLDGPGRRRSIGGRAKGLDQPSAIVIAVSPDGALAAVAGERVVRDGVHPIVRIVRVADGRVLAALDTKDAIADGLSTDGQWHGSTIVTVTGYCCGRSISPVPAVVVLRFHDGHLTLRRVAPIDYEDIGEQRQNRPSAHQPRILGPNAIGVWLNGYKTRWLTCKLVASTCRAGRAVRAPPDDRIRTAARIVTQPGE